MANERRGSFSRRNNLRPANPPATIWDDAPSDFRHAVLQVAVNDCGTGPDDLRDVLCKVLRKRPNPNNWSPSNIWDEVQGLMEKCEWYCVYDIIEAIHEKLGRNAHSFRGNMVRAADTFTAQVNELLAEFGIAWKLVDGLFQARGEESFEAILKAATEALDGLGKATAHAELAEAVLDISRRPDPDCSGAIQHAMAALECVARDVTSDPKATLGSLLKQNKDLFPKPVDTAVDKLWGFASENGRHLAEGRDPSREEAMLVVGIAASLSNYLVHKFA
ncbi:MAG: hypothetical protein R3C17_08520 [Planctomycetaceae bacterium]